MDTRALSNSEAHARISCSAGLSDDIERLRFVKGARADALRRLGIETVRDLFLHVPRRYLDFSEQVPIALASMGQNVTVVGRVDKVRLKQPRPRLKISELSVVDDTGVLIASFFRQPWVVDQVKEGDIIALSGKLGFFGGFKQMNTPFYEVLGNVSDASSYTRVLPVHPATEGLSAAWLRRILSAALFDRGNLSDPLPSELACAHELMSFGRAVRELHFPANRASAEAARRRLAFDELLYLQLALLSRTRIATEEVKPFVHVRDGQKMQTLIAKLGFELSHEQKQATEEILGDMVSPFIMNRLLLGDVGTGKTAVCAVALAACADSKTQGAVMAPTSVLARQYAEKIGPILDASGISWTLITSATPVDEREIATSAIERGEIDVVFGTTALLSDDVRFKALSLVVIDEQHRFGVNQRARLRAKGPGCDLLTMTATPIPRTLALSLYGDIDCSRIRHRPIQGAKVTTKSISPELEHVALNEIAEAISRGEQAYVVCPVIDDADDGTELDDVPEQTMSSREKLHSAVVTYERLSKEVFPENSVGLLTGRLSAAEKDEVMAAFRAGEIQILVSTTVVEVGVDVASASVMLIYDADRFGLATLHQLRGRVGRSSIPGVVYLECAAEDKSAARERLNTLERTSDGFELAELDLKLRHEGELLGYRQHGGVSLSIADLAVDSDLIEFAHRDARSIILEDPKLESELHVPMALELKDRFGIYFEELERL